MIYVIYHASCLDGAAAKYIAWTKFKDNAQYLSCQYGQDFPIDIETLTQEDEIYILDFSFSREILESLVLKVKKLLVLDHHKSAQEQLAGFDHAIFDMNESGASLTWMYFYPEEPIPLTIAHVKDRDLWQFKLQGTKAICAYLYSENYQNNVIWENLINTNDIYFEARRAGEVLVKQVERACEAFINPKNPKYKIVEFLGHKAAFYNTTTLISEISEYLYTNLDIEMTLSYFISQEGKVCFSLRAPKHTELNVRKLAEVHQGGGHDKAAGFNLDIDKGLRLLNHLYKALPKKDPEEGINNTPEK